MENWRPDMITVEVYTNFLYPGMMLKGDGYDENENKIIDKDKPLSKDLIEKLKKDGVKKIRYTRTKLNVRKQTGEGAIAETKFEKAISIIGDIEGSIKQEGQSARIPSGEISEVVNGFISDIRDHNDACLNLIDLVEHNDITYTHSINVSTISILIGLSMSLEEEKVRILGVAGLLHDIGKIMIPEEILNKEGKLTPEEWTILKSHPVLGYNIVHGDKTFGEDVEKAVLCHHENYNGNGYPFGLSHEKINQYSMIISLADVFDAATTDRPYKKGLPFDEAFSYFMKNSGMKFPPGPTQVFLNNLIKKLNGEPLYPEKSYVYLNTGEVGYVVGHRLTPYSLRPIVNIFLVPQTADGAKSNRMLKVHQQIDLQNDYNRYIIKRITDNDIIMKFDSLLGRNNREEISVKEK